MKQFKLNIHHESYDLQEYRQTPHHLRFYDSNSLVASPPTPEYRREYLTEVSLGITTSGATDTTNMDEINRAYQVALGRANRYEAIYGSSYLTLTGVDVESRNITVDSSHASSPSPTQPPTSTEEYIAQRRQGTSRFSNFIQDLLPDSITRSRR